MTVTFPEGTLTLGSREVTIIPIADVDDPDALKKTEVDGGFLATCYIYGNGGMVSGTQNKGNAPRRLCETKDREQLGTVQETISDIQYTYNPQAPANDAKNAMKSAMVQGTKVVIAERLGILSGTASAVGQFYNTYVVTLGYQNRTWTSEDEYSEFSVTQGASVQSAHYDVALA